MGAAGWKHLCTSYHIESDQLCEAIAKLAIRVSTTYVDPGGLTFFGVQTDSHPQMPWSEADWCGQSTAQNYEQDHNKSCMRRHTSSGGSPSAVC